MTSAASRDAETPTVSLPAPLPPGLPPVELTPNGRKVLEHRYLRKDEDGTITETAEDRLWNMCLHIAQAERQYLHDGHPDPDSVVMDWAHRFYEIVRTTKFLPNSPTIKNAGPDRMGTLSGCFAAGTMITTDQGPLPIEVIQPGMRVLTHRNRYRPVTEIMRRQSKLYRMKVDKLPVVAITEEHPVMTERGWVQVKDLRPLEDFIQVGVSGEISDAPPIRVEGVQVGELVYQANAADRSDRARRKSGDISSQVNPVAAEIMVDAEVAWLLGMYVAQGSISAGYDLAFTVGLHNRAQIDRIVQIFQDRFGLTARSRDGVDRKRGHMWVSTRVSSKLLCGWIDAEFGHGFAGKRIPQWLMHAPADVQAAFLQGVADGDGTAMNSSQVRITLSNERLVRQLFEIVVRLGYQPNLSAEHMGRLATTRAWSVTYGPNVNAGMCRNGYYRLRSITPVDDHDHDVFNFEVADDHSYVANQMVVHNCYVVPVDDSLDGEDGMFSALRAGGLVLRYGGGVGYALTRIRPKGDPIRGTHGAACGPIEFLRLLSAMSKMITQGGAFRPGANMAVMRVDHPDIQEFVHCKDSGVEILNFNISVGVTNEFMEAKAGRSPFVQDFEQAVREDATQLLRNGTGDKGYKWQVFPKQEEQRQGLSIDQYAWGKYAFPLRFKGRIYSWINARTLWDEIAQSAWATGDPGLLFIDRMNGEQNPCSHLFDIETSNPCGEQGLEPYGSCNLGSIDVSKYFVGFTSDNQPIIDWEAFETDIRVAIRFLDNVVSVNSFPTPDFERANRLARRIGFGPMGVADLLIKARLAYGTPAALAMVDDVMAFMERIADEESLALGEERGVYDGWEGSLHQQQGLRYRNAFRTTVAPTGTISLIAGCSSGIEPHFDLVWQRFMHDGTPILEFHPEIQKLIDAGADFDDIPEWIRVTNEVSPQEHVDTQAVCQKRVNNSISKTVNMANDATVETVKECYQRAWDHGCKGITIYRDGSRGHQILNHLDLKEAVAQYRGGSAPAIQGNRKTPGVVATYADTGDGGMLMWMPKPAHLTDDPGVGASEQPPFAVGGMIDTTNLPPLFPEGGLPDGLVIPSVSQSLPRTRPSITHKFTLDGQEGFLTASYFPDTGRIGEIFIRISKQGSLVSGLCESLAMVMSKAFRKGVDLDEITKNLRGVKFEPYGRVDNPEIPKATSFVDYIAHWLDVTFPSGIYAEFAPAAPRHADLYSGVWAPVHQVARTTALKERPVAVPVSSGEGCPECGNVLIYEEGCLRCRDKINCDYSRC